MDTSFQQPSFIPKKPVTGPAAPVGSSILGTLFLLVTGFIFVASLVAAGGVFFYRGLLQGQIVTKTDTLKTEIAAFDPKTVADLVRLDSRINNASALLQKHTTVLAIFNYLSQQTLQTVQFTNFSFDVGDKGQAQMTLSGVADSFATVALQSDQFSASTVLKNIVFSGIVVNTTGQIKFDVKADLDPSLLSYAKNLTAAVVPTPANTTPSITPTIPTLPTQSAIPPASSTTRTTLP